MSVTKWTRTQSNKLLLDGGLAVYDQEYQENYQPGVTAGAVPLVTLFDQVTGKFAGAWNNPADHFSKLFTESLAASYVTGSHSFRFGGSFTEGRWRLAQTYTGDAQPVTYNGILPNGNINPVSVTLRIPTDRRNAINMDAGLFAQDRWTISRMTINAGIRYDQFIGSTMPESLPASTLNAATSFSNCPDGLNSLQNNCTGRVQNWKDISPRVGLSFDVFGDGKTAIKASVARYVNGQQIGTADAANPETTVGLSDVRAWKDLDNNGSPYDSAGHLQTGELTPSASTPNFGKNIATTTTTDPSVLNGWGVRQYNWEYAISGQHELAPKVSVNGGYYRRSFGNQTVTVDNRYNTSSYDGPFCVNAPSDPNLPGGGGYPVCGLYDLKPALVSLPASSTIYLSSKFGGETNIYQGFEASVIARPKSGAYFQAGINASKRIFDECNLVAAGIKSVTLDGTTANIGAGGAGLTNTQSELTEIYADGSKACHQEYGYRPDFKLFGSYTLPFDIVFSGSYQYSRGVQGGSVGGNSVLATWAAPNATIQSSLGRPLSAGAATKVISLIEPGTNYGTENLSQLDLRASKRITLDKLRVRVDFDAYNIFNSDWPFTVSNVFSTAATATWLRPANVLQARFFKIGLNFDF